jgi:hypothetical protein
VASNQTNASAAFTVSSIRTFNCVSYNNANDGFESTSDRNGLYVNCISYSDGALAFDTGASDVMLNCASDGAATGHTPAGTPPIIEVGKVTLTAGQDPFTNAAAGDFSLNPAGPQYASLKAAGFKWAGQLAYLDMGAVQHSGEAVQLAVDQAAVTAVAGSILDSVENLLGTVDGTYEEPDPDFYWNSAHYGAGGALDGNMTPADIVVGAGTLAVTDIKDGVILDPLGSAPLQGTYTGAGYTYGDEDPDEVLTTATGAGHYHAPLASEVISTATFGHLDGVSGTYDVSDVAEGNIVTGSSIGGVAGTYPTTATTTTSVQAADAAILETDKAYLLATKTITFGAAAVTGTLAVGNVLTAVTGGTYHAPEVGEVLSTASFGVAPQTGSYVAPDAAGYSDLAAGFGAGGATPGTLDSTKIMVAVYGSLAASNVLVAGGGTYVDPDNADVRAGVAVGVNPRAGTLVGCVDSEGVNQGSVGILADGAIFHADGVLDGDGVHSALALWVLKTDVASAEDVRDGTPCYVGGGNGSLAVPLPSNVRFGVDTDDTTGTLIGVVDAAGTWHAYGTCTSAQAWAAAGIIHTAGTAAASGILNTGGTFAATGYFAGGANAIDAIGLWELVTTGDDRVAAQLSDDKDAVTAGKADILNTRTILTIVGTFDLAANDAAVATAHLVADVSTLNDHLDEMIAANTEIKAHYVGVLDGTAVGGGGGGLLVGPSALVS